MVAATGVDDGSFKTFSTMGIGFGFNDPNFSDRKLRIEFTTDDSHHSSSKVTMLHICSLVLASQSPFFYKMFSNGMKESMKRVVDLTLHASEELPFMDLLQFLYKNKLEASKHEDLLKVLILADKYQVNACVTYCAQLLSSYPLTFKLAASCISLPSSVLEGDNSSLQSLVEAANYFLSKNFSRHREEALELPLESIEKLLCGDSLRVDCEDDVCDFVIEWVRGNYKDLQERHQVFSSRLLHLIRFPYMSCEKVKSLLECKEPGQGDGTKMVMEALLSKSGNHLSQLLSRSSCPKRDYKWLPVEVTALDRPHKEYNVYAELKKEDCCRLAEGLGPIYTQDFHVGNESFDLMFDVSYSRLLEVILEQSTGDDDDDISMSETEQGIGEEETNILTQIAVRWRFGNTKSTSPQTAPWAILGCGQDSSYFIGRSWDSFMADDSQYFINDVLYVRFTITLLQ